MKKRALTADLVNALLDECRGDELKAIHPPIADAYRAVSVEMKTFAAKLVADNLEERYKALIAVMDAVPVAEEKYLADLKSYYDKNRVTLQDE